MTIPAPTPNPHEIMEMVLTKGDLAKLDVQERTRYYSEVCKSLGLNPLTKPFEYINLNGRLVLYALRTATDQLRRINNVSIELLSRDVKDGILTIHVRARMPDGRVDEDLGTVSFPDSLTGVDRANAELRAVTKAKRRVTLSICGLGWLDETEIEDIPSSAKRTVAEDPPISDEQVEELKGLIIEIKPATRRNGKPVSYDEYEKKWLDLFEIESLADMQQSKFADNKATIEAKRGRQ